MLQLKWIAVCKSLPEFFWLGNTHSFHFVMQQDSIYNAWATVETRAKIEKNK